MFELLRTISGYSVPVFVVATMLNVGLTQRLGAILEHLSNRPFMLKMLAANFIGAPLLMVGALKLISLDPELKVGLLIFSLCAGAPFLIKLTQASKNEMALGAAVMMMLMLATTIYVPIVFPMLLDTLTVGAWDIASALTVQMILPTAIGMLMVQFASQFAETVQPWIGRLSTARWRSCWWRRSPAMLPQSGESPAKARSCSRRSSSWRRRDSAGSPVGDATIWRMSARLEPRSAIRRPGLSSPARISRAIPTCW